MNGARAWVLNLDAEHELETPGHLTVPRGLRQVLARERSRLLGNLVAPGDVVLTGGPDDARARGLPGFAWSPTPSALRRLRAAGARPLPAPAADVLRTANARPFATAVRAALQAPGSFAKHVVATLDEACAILSRPAPDGWLVRRTFGAAGRGRRRLPASRPIGEALAWLDASLRRGPLVLEPWVVVTGEYTRSGWVHRDGRVEIAPPCRQATTATGAWLHTARAARDEVIGDDDARLEEAVGRAGAALAAAGYFGPFGIDAYRHRRPGSRSEALNPISEINARFTMDWAVGMTGRADAGAAARRLAELIEARASSA